MSYYLTSFHTFPVVVLAVVFFFSFPWRSVAAVHPGGAGTFRTAGKLWQDSLESHEVSGRGECGELHFQIYSTSDWTLMSRSAAVSKFISWGGSRCSSWSCRRLVLCPSMDCGMVYKSKAIISISEVCCPSGKNTVDSVSKVRVALVRNSLLVWRL